MSGSTRERIGGATWVRGVVLAALLFFFLGPIALLVVGSLKPDALVLPEAGSWKAFVPTAASPQNYSDVFDRADFGRFLFNSLFVNTAIVILAVVLNSLAGYAFARLRWRGREPLFGVVLALLILPFEAIAVPLFYEVTLLGWRDSYHVQIIPFIASPFLIFLFYTFFLGLPRELEESARVDGAGPWRTFVQIIVPLSKPAYATAAVLTFLTQWGSFMWPLMVTSGSTYRPLPVGLAMFYTLPPVSWGDILAFGVMMVAPILVVFLLFRGWFIRGITFAGLRR